MATYKKADFQDGAYIGDLSAAARARRVHEILSGETDHVVDKMFGITILKVPAQWHTASYKAEYLEATEHLSLFMNPDRFKANVANSQQQPTPAPESPAAKETHDPLFSEEEASDDDEPVMSSDGKKRALATKAPAPKKSKASPDSDGASAAPTAPAEVSAQTEVVPYKDALDCKYQFKDRATEDTWDSWKGFRSVNVNGVEYHVGDIVLIHYRNKFGDLEDKRDPKNFWLGQVHKFKKAEDEDCVALVAWLYWPSDLEGPIGVDANGRLEKPKNGAKGYHGEHELIASNHLELVSIYSFEGNFTKDVEKYDESDDNKVIRQYYYRQTFDLRTQRLSNLRRYCICRKYSKADETLLQCANKDCGLWHHKECIVDAYCMAAWRAKATSKKLKVGSVNKPKAGEDTDANSHLVQIKRNARLYKQHYKAEIQEDMKSIVLEDLNPLDKGFFEPEIIKCLKCKTDFK